MCLMKNIQIILNRYFIIYYIIFYSYIVRVFLTKGELPLSGSYLSQDENIHNNHHILISIFHQLSSFAFLLLLIITGVNYINLTSRKEQIITMFIVVYGVYHLIVDPLLGWYFD